MAQPSYSTSYLCVRCRDKNHRLRPADRFAGGMYHDDIADAVRWLRGRQDAAGRFGLGADPDWLLDHALVTMALAEHARHLATSDGEAFRRGGGGWTKAQKTLTAITKSQVKVAGAPHGSWDPQGPFGERCGRLGTSAANVLILQIYYRYSKLAFVTN